MEKLKEPKRDRCPTLLSKCATGSAASLAREGRIKCFRLANKHTRFQPLNSMQTG